MMGLVTLRRLARRCLASLLDRVSDARLQGLLVQTAIHRAKTRPPADGLRFLFGLEAAIYPVQGELAVAHGAGVHTKHRHTRYHEFFINRIRAGERVLDVGCGIGAVAYDIAEYAKAEVVGIDLGEADIATARLRYAHPQVRYVVGNVLRDLPDGRFDVVILSNILEHLPGRPEFLRRVQAVAEPARLLIRVPLFERDWRVPLKRELGVEWRLDPTHETEYTLESFAQEMAEVGLIISHQEVRWGEIWAEGVWKSC
jgi:ubiquinone/menaquinone biosynthesis C-methylase UbiE